MSFKKMSRDEEISLIKSQAKKVGLEISESEIRYILDFADKN